MFVASIASRHHPYREHTCHPRANSVVNSVAACFVLVADVVVATVLNVAVAVSVATRDRAAIIRIEKAPREAARLPSRARDTRTTSVVAFYVARRVRNIYSVPGLLRLFVCSFARSFVPLHVRMHTFVSLPIRSPTAGRESGE